MHDRGSLVEVAFRYAGWLHETEQWEVLDLFAWVIHPAIGQLAGEGKTRVADLTPAVIGRALLTAAWRGVAPELATGAWSDFFDFLDVEGIAHGPLPADYVPQAPP